MAEALLDDDSFDMVLLDDSASLPSCLDSSSSSAESTTSDSSCERAEYKFRNRQLLKRVRKNKSDEISQAKMEAKNQKMIGYPRRISKEELKMKVDL